MGQRHPFIDHDRTQPGRPRRVGAELEAERFDLLRHGPGIGDRAPPAGDRPVAAFRQLLPAPPQLFGFLAPVLVEGDGIDPHPVHHPDEERVLEAVVPALRGADDGHGAAGRRQPCCSACSASISLAISVRVVTHANGVRARISITFRNWIEPAIRPDTWAWKPRSRTVGGEPILG